MTPTIIRHTTRRSGAQVFVVISYSVKALPPTSGEEFVFQHYEGFINTNTYLKASEVYTTADTVFGAFEAYVAKWDELAANPT